MPYLLCQDHHIYCEIKGEGSAVIFLHNATGASGDWRLQRSVFVASGYQVIVYDRRGFGRSEPLPIWSEDYHWEGVDELIDLMYELHVAEAVLVGHSDGATIALMAAAAYPSFIRCVVAESPHMWIEPVWLERGFRSFNQTLGNSARFLAALRRDHGDQADVVLSRWQGRWLDPAFRDWNQGHLLQAIQAPVLVIHGLRDVFFPVNHSQQIADAIENGDFWLLEDAGHTPHLEQAERFNQHVLNFLLPNCPPHP